MRSGSPFDLDRAKHSLRVRRIIRDSASGCHPQSPSRCSAASPATVTTWTFLDSRRILETLSRQHPPGCPLMRSP